MQDTCSETSQSPTFDLNILKMLLDERDRHLNQILAINGKACFIVLALVASALVSAGKIKEAIGSSATAPMVLAYVLLAASVVLIFWANAEHYWFRMKRVRFFERASNFYLRSGTLIGALSEAEPGETPSAGSNPFLLLPPDRLLYFHRLIFFAMLCMVLGAVCFVISVL